MGSSYMTIQASISLATQITRRLVFLALRVMWLPFVLREVFQRKKVTILVYHTPSAEFFDTHIRFLKHVYHIVPLAAYLEARQRGELSKLPPKALVITLDDGYRSNYELKDIIEKHDVPVTIFLCSGLIDTHRKFWFYNEETSAIVQQLKTVRDEERIAILRKAGFEETQEFEGRQALSASEITDLKKTVDFQSHTVFHPILPRCSSEKVETELVQSRMDLQTRLGKEVYAFAYPNGDYSERELRLAEEAGYRCALTLDPGFNTARTPLFRLRRICIPDNADLHELVVKASGLWGGIMSILGRGRRPGIGAYL
jgi:peptidoglycan/xylan/chitin deacetylase (PgdA/CDA1 family)